MIKLGRVKLKIKEIKLNDAGDNSIDNNHTKHFATKVNDKSINENNRDRASNLNNENININKNANNVMLDQSNTNVKLNIKKHKNICRICYCDETEVDSPLISPCSCSGTMKFIHFFCLQTWLKSKIIVKSTITDHCASFSLKEIECELCKVVFPGKIYSKFRFCQIQAKII